MNPGDMLSRDIRLRHPLDKGTMGSVWVADHLGLGLIVAVKILSAAFATDPNYVLRFHREAQAAARIDSPHVVRILGSGVSKDGLPFIVMELLQGETLQARLDDTSRLSLATTCTLVGQVCHALSPAHAMGIIHRDIKPANIFLTEPDGKLCIKLLDFGVAKVQTGPGAGRMTQTRDRVGTPFYMSPEQLFSAKHVDHRADLWSLAVVAYRCLTGQLPYHGEVFWELVIAVKRGGYAPASGMRPELPAPIDTWFERALHTQAAFRFPSAAQMAQELERAVGPA
jgi:eukaryotic-like serine/threonine-protein kinase